MQFCTGDNVLNCNLNMNVVHVIIADYICSDHLQKQI